MNLLIWINGTVSWKIIKSYIYWVGHYTKQLSEKNKKINLKLKEKLDNVFQYKFFYFVCKEWVCYSSNKFWSVYFDLFIWLSTVWVGSWILVFSSKCFNQVSFFLLSFHNT